MTKQTLAAVIPAAGSGTRTGLAKNKILAPLCGKPLLWRTLTALARAKVLLEASQWQMQECVIVARPEEFESLEAIGQSANLPFSFRLVCGGNSRQESVFNAIKTITADWALVHDAARPLVSPELIATVCQQALQSDAAIAALPATDTVKLAKINSPHKVSVKSTFDRSQIWLAQTPQVFRRHKFQQALQSAQNDSFTGTDCASLMERQGHAVSLVNGQRSNIKITHAQDLEYAEFLMEKTGFV